MHSSALKWNIKICIVLSCKAGVGGEIQLYLSSGFCPELVSYYKEPPETRITQVMPSVLASG